MRFAALALLMLCSCVNTKTRLKELELFHDVQQDVASTPEKEREYPIVLRRLPADAPAMYPFAAVAISSASRNSIANAAERKGREFGADVALIIGEGKEYAGSVGDYWGFGITTSTPIYAATAKAVLLNKAPCRLGIQCDETRMVTTLHDDVRAASGLLEGDKLVSIRGVAVDYSWDSPYWRVIRETQPGDELEAIWIRPGKGRMSGKFTALDNTGGIDPNLNVIIKRRPKNAIDETHLIPPKN